MDAPREKDEEFTLGRLSKTLRSLSGMFGRPEISFERLSEDLRGWELFENRRSLRCGRFSDPVDRLAESLGRVYQSVNRRRDLLGRGSKLLRPSHAKRF